MTMPLEKNKREVPFRSLHNEILILQIETLAHWYARKKSIFFHFVYNKIEENKNLPSHFLTRTIIFYEKFVSGLDHLDLNQRIIIHSLKMRTFKVFIVNVSKMCENAPMLFGVRNNSTPFVHDN